MRIERSDFIDHLELAEGLEEVVFIVGGFPLHEEDREQLENPGSVGTRFLFDMRDVIDGENNRIYMERVSKERSLVLCEQVGAAQAIEMLREELRREHEVREEKAFKLYRPASHEGAIVRVELPAWMPDWLTKVKHGA